MPPMHSTPNKKAHTLICVFVAILCLLCGIHSPAEAAEKKTISVSNRPLAFVLKAIVDDHFHINIIIPDNSDPHHFQLRPSIVLKVQKSDLLVWLGPKIEPNLAALMVSKDALNRVTLAEELDLNFLPIRSRDHSHHENQAPRTLDPHVWLSPTRMLLVARLLTTRLQEDFPELAGALGNKLQAFQRDVATKLSVEALQLNRQSSGMIYHDAYQYFQQEYQLKNVGFIVTELDEVLSLRQLLNLKKISNQNLVDCVLIEPGYNPKLLAKIFGENLYRKELMDPLGRNIKLTPTAYVEYIVQIAETYKRCQ